MQTLCAHGESDRGSSADSRAFRLKSALKAVAVSAATAACCLAFATPAGALPGIAGQGGDESEASACESALTQGYRNDARYDSSLPSSVRLLSAVTAQNAWHAAAVQCPQRFAEGTVRSAAAAYAAQTLARQLGVDGIVSTPSAQVPDGLTLGADAAKVAALCLAEDRAGFAFEVLAAKRDADASLAALSDQRKANAQTLSTAASHEQDPRQKLYAVDALSDPDTATDPTTGIKAPTPAVVEMNVAMEQLSAFAASNNSGAGAAKGSEAKNSGAKAQGSDSGSEAKNSESGTKDSKVSQTEAHDLDAISTLISGHITTAYDLGYPATPTLLLQ